MEWEGKGCRGERKEGDEPLSVEEKRGELLSAAPFACPGGGQQGEEARCGEEGVQPTLQHWSQQPHPLCKILDLFLLPYTLISPHTHEAHSQGAHKLFRLRFTKNLGHVIMDIHAFKR